jgi:hypothetical protein
MTSDPRPIEEAPVVGRRLLGTLLQQRRVELGYTHRPAFARDRLPLTPSGNPNTRLLADLEEAYRDNFPEPRLRQLARAYQVTFESMVDIAHLRHNLLIPAAPEAPSPGIPAGWDAPFTDLARRAADRPWFDSINERRVELAAMGITDPSGAQMFGRGTDDAKAWDSIGARLPIADRVWFIADLRRRAHGRGGTSGNSAAGA